MSHKYLNINKLDTISLLLYTYIIKKVSIQKYKYSLVKDFEIHENPQDFYINKNFVYFY